MVAGPVKTGETASPRYRQALAAHQAAIAGLPERCVDPAVAPRRRKAGPRRARAERAPTGPGRDGSWRRGGCGTAGGHRPAAVRPWVSPLPRTVLRSAWAGWAGQGPTADQRAVRNAPRRHLLRTPPPTSNGCMNQPTGRPIQVNTLCRLSTPRSARRPAGQLLPGPGRASCRPLQRPAHRPGPTSASCTPVCSRGRRPRPLAAPTVAGPGGLTGPRAEPAGSGIGPVLTEAGPRDGPADRGTVWPG